ncbi:MAG TPA: hypothetical protein VJB61_19785 [Actinomycetota bacterium]
MPALTGMQLAGAKRRLAARGLELRVRYRRTARYVQGPVQVRPPDPFDLDSDADGIGCERD